MAWSNLPLTYQQERRRIWTWCKTRTGFTTVSTAVFFLELYEQFGLLTNKQKRASRRLAKIDADYVANGSERFMVTTRRIATGAKR